jgi:roadblock/LC7 domain-containing protein
MKEDSMRPQKPAFCLGLFVPAVCLLSVCSFAASPQPQTAVGEKGQSVALPAAKEDLLGELSDEPKEVEEVVLSNDGMRFAAKIKRGKQWVLVVDGKEGPAFEYIAGIRFSLPSAQHIAYAVRRGGKWTEMIDEKELGPEFDALAPDPSRNPHPSAGPTWMSAPYTPGSVGGLLNGLDAAGMLYTLYSTRLGQNVAPTSTEAAKAMQESSWFWQGDTLQRHAYGIRRGKTSLMIIDSKNGPDFEEVGGPAFSPDGKRLAYAAKHQKQWRVVMDGAEGPGFQEVGAPVFSQDGQRVVYAAKSEKQWAMIERADSGPKFVEISPPYFSPEGKRLAYWAKRQTKKGTSGSEDYVISELIVADGKEGPEFGAAGPPVFSPDGLHLAYWAKGKKKERTLIVDGQPKFEFNELLAGPQFSPDGQHIAYVDWSNGGFKGTLDGKSVAETKALGYHALSLGKYFAEQITFSPNSQRLAYVVVSGGENYWEGATKRAKRRAVVVGHEDNLYDAYGLDDLTFSPDSHHFAYIVHGGLKKDKSAVVMDGREGDPYDSVLTGVFRTNASGGPFSADFVYIAREGRKFFRVTQPLP